jgi:NADPH:quinone reductase-like Zn-dependent oxidoreductase
MAPLIEGRIEPVIDRVVPIEQTEAAHAAVEGNENTGKVILKVREDS